MADCVARYMVPPPALLAPGDMVYHPTACPPLFVVTNDREYWRRVYAGQALAGLAAGNRDYTSERAVEKALRVADLLVAALFKEPTDV